MSNCGRERGFNPCRVHNKPFPDERILSYGGAGVSNTDLTSILFVLLLLVGLAQLLGYVLVKCRQPKVVGEILAGIVLGPALIGRLPFASVLTEATKHQASTWPHVA